VLDLTGCSNVGEYGDRGLKEIGGNLTCLKQLHYCDARRVEDSGILSITTGLGSSASAGEEAGCRQLEVLTLSGCENFTQKGLKALMKNLRVLQQLQLKGCGRLTDNDVEDSFQAASRSLSLPSPVPSSTSSSSLPLSATSAKKTAAKHKLKPPKDPLPVPPSPTRGLEGSVREGKVFPSLTSLSLIECSRLSDRAVAAFCQQLGGQLLQLSLKDCRHLTDYSGLLLGRFCTRLRELDLSGCGQFTDSAVRSLAVGVSCLTSLKLDGNRGVTTRGLLRFIDKEVRFDPLSSLDLMTSCSSSLLKCPTNGWVTRRKVRVDQVE
jgi:hypothetical protein